MHISNITNIYFKSSRQDRNQVKRLSVQSAPISENQGRNIDLALEELSQNPSADNIRFLISTAQNLAYGIPQNSELREKLLASTPLQNLQPSNTDWELKLKQAAQNALSKNYSGDKAALTQELEKAFSQRTTMSPDEYSILENRKIILDSSILNGQKDKSRTENVRKNLDYFIFSSEISTADKAYCLEKMSYFLSKKYKINPQLKDKKLQVLDEVLNDIIIKTPQEAANTIKNVNQRHHGMCAAISACRKLLAYTDKRNYVDNIFSELSASPTMEIFDITQLGSGIKIPVEKVFIDFDDAISQNYRIIDASALQWMQNAARTGDGNIKISDYVPFDKDNFEVYADSFWFSGFPEGAENVHEMLKSAIKARYYAAQIHQKQAHMSALFDDFKNSGISSLKNLERLNKKFEERLSVIMANKTCSEIKSIASEILNLHKGSQYVLGTNYKHQTAQNPAFIINPDEPEEVQKEKIKNFLLQFSSQELVGKEIDELFGTYQQITSALNIYKGNFQSQHSPKSIARYYKLLFLYATAYQDTLEKNLDEFSYASQCLSIYNLETRRATIRNHFNNIMKSLKKEHEAQDYTLLAKLLKANPEKNELLEKMQSFSNQFEANVNNKRIKILQQFGFADEKETAIALIKAYIENIKTNDKEEIANLSKTYKLKPTKFAALKRLNKMLSEVENDTYKGNLESILSDFGIKDEISFFNDITKSLATMLENPDAKMENPKPLFFFIKNILNNPKVDLFNTLPDIENDIAKLQNYVLSVEEKFNVPAPKNVVLAYHRKKGETLNNEEFEILRKKFLAISRYDDLLNDSTERIHDPEIYHFSKDEKEIIKRILKNFSKSERYINKLYKAINRKFSNELNEIYNQTGRLNGDFWTREEGSSGLFDSQEIKILEQMTGRPFHIEKDLRKAIEEIKSGIGGGEVNTCVCDDEFSGHAQFLYAVSPIQMLDSKSKELKTVDAFWHDNSWGRFEHKNAWIDENGLTRTNYDNGTGGKNGFIVRSNDTTGWDVEYAMYGKGIHKPQQIDNPRESKYYKFVGEEYSLFDSIMLPGESNLSKEKAYKLAREILETNPTKKRLKALFSKIDNGEFPTPKRYGDIFDKTISSNVERVIKEAKKIKSEEELLALPEDDPIKIALQKMSILKTPYGKENQDIIDNMMTQKDIDKYNRQLLNKLKLFTAGYLEQNSMLVNSEKIKDALLNYIFDFEKDNHCKYPQLKTSIFQALRILENEINGNLKANVMTNISNVIEKSVRSSQHKEQLKTDLLKLFSAYYDETFSPESIIKNTDFVPILNIIDKKFNPESDNELKSIIEQLRHADKSQISKLLKEASLEDFGIKYQPIYEILKVIQSENYEANDDFNSALFTYYAYDLLPKEPEMKAALGNTYDIFKQKYDKSVNTLYRTLYVSLSYAEIDGIINKHRDEYLRKYSIRASFPDVKFHSDKDIYNATDTNLETIRKVISLYQETLEEGKLLELVEKLKSYDFDNLPATEKFYETNIYPIFSAIQKSTVVGDLGKNCLSTLSAIHNTEASKIQEKYNLFKTLVNQLNEIEPVFNKTLLVEKKEKYKKKFKELIHGSVDGFVSNPNQKTQMVRLLKQYVKAVSNNKPAAEIDKLGTEIKAHACKHYALKNPTKLLDEVIKLKIQDKMNGTNANKEKIAIGMKLLNEALDSAHKTEIECKIMDEINSGRIYDLKKNLENYTYETSDGATTKILSDKGIYFLFDTLYSPGSPDPMSTVNLLCQHSGLSEDFCRVLTGKFEITKFQKLYTAFRERIQTIKKETDLCKKLFEEMIALPHTNYHDSAVSYIETLNNAIGQNPKAMKSYINNFKNFAENLSNLSDAIANKGTLSQQQKEKATKELLQVTHQKSINQIVYDFAPHIKKFNDSSIEFEKGIDILKNLKLSKFSPQQESKAILLKTLEKMKELSYLIGEEAEAVLDSLYVETPDNINITI